MKKRLLSSILLSALVLSGCGGGGGSSGDSDYHYTPQDISARDVTVPTELPKYEERSFQIHYRREDNKYKDWGLWLWDGDAPENNDEVVDTFNYQDDFGVIGYYKTSYLGKCTNGRIGFIIRKLASWDKDGATPDGGDGIIDFSVLKADANNCYHAYIYSGDRHVYSNPDKALNDEITIAAFTDVENIKVETTNKVEKYTLYKDNEPILVGEGINSNSFKIMLPNDHPTAELTSIYKITIKFAKTQAELTKSVSIANLYSSEEFNKAFNYDGELGAIYTKQSTTFKVWSPISSSIKLRIYSNGTPKSVSTSLGSDEYVEHAMTKGEKGVFSVKIDGDLEGKYYTYVVTNGANYNREIVDPYAKSAGINGARGMIVDFSKTNPEGWDEVEPHQYNRNELTVWETHVADVTSHSSWTGSEANRRKFLGMIEKGTTYTGSYKGVEMTVSTGFDHIKELGVNAVQILPMFDQANDETKYSFNWGYNPLNYNVVEGLYSSDPYDGYARISDLKKVVQAFNEAGINIIMDVVYNHVNGADGSNFDVLMPGYYFRYNEAGGLSNGSGCGNETASEMPMMRKFIVDSTKFWASEYKLGGFRFDLMGLHDLTTMNELTAECQKINPAIVIYGEPWTGGESAMKGFDSNSAKQSNGNKYQGYGQFNDAMRDALIKGGLNADSATGWITNPDKVNSDDVSKIKKGIAGITAANPEIADPNKTVNYVTCHDNYTLLDRVKKASTPLVYDDIEFEYMAVLANAVIFTSQGTAFMLAGEEMLRTKNGDNNSYKSPDSVNQYNYFRKIRYNSIFENYKALIAFKQEVTDLHSSTSKVNVTDLEGGAVLKYSLQSGDKEYMVIHCNGVGAKNAIDLSGYKVVLDTRQKLEVGTALDATYVPTQYQTLIALKNAA